MVQGQEKNSIRSAEFVVFVAALSIWLRVIVLGSRLPHSAPFLTMLTMGVVAAGTSRFPESKPDMLAFASGSLEDPKPLVNERSKRFARCTTHNRIVHFSKVLLKWTYDDGSFHNSGCELENPRDWLPNAIANAEALAGARKLLSQEAPF